MPQSHLQRTIPDAASGSQDPHHKRRRLPAPLQQRIQQAPARSRGLARCVAFSMNGLPFHSNAYARAHL